MLDNIDKLYHYTDSYGLLGILENEVIWANDLLFQNDYHEFLQGFLLLQKILQENPMENELGLFMQVINKSFDEQVLRDIVGNFHIISFSTVADSLDLWRGYSKSNHSIV